MKHICNIIIVCCLLSCTPSIYKAAHSNYSPLIEHREESNGYQLRFDTNYQIQDNSFSYTDKKGKTTFFNEAYIDEKSGETMSMFHLNHIVVSAKSNNVAERNGIITLEFVITIPPELLHNNWQTIIIPTFSRDKKQEFLQKIVISGNQFKESQRKGYSKYDAYINKIITAPDTDLTIFSRYTDLLNFIDRNLPESLITSGINDNILKTSFGVGEQEIIDAYTRKKKIERNKRRIANKEEAFEKYVKTPYNNKSRLDSIVTDIRGNFQYHYKQEIPANKNSAKINLWLEAKLRSRYGSAISLKCSDTIKYNVSSISGLTDLNTRYLKKIVEKHLRYNFKSHFIFSVNSHTIDTLLANNRAEALRTDSLMKEITKKNLYSIDSLKITSASSPEGKYSLNKTLSHKRAKSISEYIMDKIEQSNNKHKIIIKDTSNGEHYKYAPLFSTDSITVENNTIPEAWKKLKQMIKESDIKQKEEILECFTIDDLDKREHALQKYTKQYHFIKKELYPRLREVNISISLVRKDMVKDTMHTTEPDTIYMKAVDYLVHKDYAKALDILDNYKDINTAIAYLSLGHYPNAQNILQSLPESAVKNYLMAVVLARRGKEKSAASYFLKAKEADIKMAYRGRLDPEINHLIKKFNLNKDLFE